MRHWADWNCAQGARARGGAAVLHVQARTDPAEQVEASRINAAPRRQGLGSLAKSNGQLNPLRVPPREGYRISDRSGLRLDAAKRAGIEVERGDIPEVHRVAVPAKQQRRESLASVARVDTVGQERDGRAPAAVKRVRVGILQSEPSTAKDETM